MLWYKPMTISCLSCLSGVTCYKTDPEIDLNKGFVIVSVFLIIDPKSARCKFILGHLFGG